MFLREQLLIQLRSQMTEAQIKLIDHTLPRQFSLVEVIWNKLEVDIIETPRTNGKYKKVTLQARQTLIAHVKRGSSIINAAKCLQINYSTAKSIFQNLKARACGKLKRKRFLQTQSENQSDELKRNNTSRS